MKAKRASKSKGKPQSRKHALTTSKTRKPKNEPKLKRPKARSKTTQVAKVSIQTLVSSLARRSYDDLSKDEKQFIKHAGPTAFKVDGWSLVPHPNVIEVLEADNRKTTRKIVAIETLRANIYFAVRDFLSKFKVNVSSYFTGGSADFICDAVMTNYEWSQFDQDLKKVLVEARAGQLEKVDNLISEFEVTDTLFLSGQKLSQLGQPGDAAFRLIHSNRLRFELACQDYTSDRFRAEFKTKSDRLRYIESLFQSHAVVGYRTLFDQCRYVDREYIPLSRGRALDNFLADRRKSSKILEPVIDLLRVRVKSKDPVEEEVTHILINEYSSPGERNDWRCATYKELGDDLNIFTFPLEGTINESPPALSDLASALLHARAYSGNIQLGSLWHPTLAEQDRPPICLESAAFGFQGITFGQPGTGKTNTDLVLLSEVADKFPYIVVLDSLESSTVKEKEMEFSGEMQAKLNYIEYPANSSSTNIKAITKKVFQTPGVSILIPPKAIVSKVFDECLSQIESAPGNQGNAQRKVDGWFLVEEARAVFLEEGQQNRFDHLEQVLREAFRKKWCVWLSTQGPVDIGYNEASRSRILSRLQNRIIHQLDQEDAQVARTLIHDSQNDGTLTIDLTSLPKWTAVICGTRNDEGNMRPLPPVHAVIRKLS
jgi:hypothetical protein